MSMMGRLAMTEETETLKITVGEPAKLSSLVYQNTSVLLVSRTGVVAVMYLKTGRGPRAYRISTDGGITWGKEMEAPGAFGGGQCSGTLRDGGVIIAARDTHPSTKYTRAKGWKGDADPSKTPEDLQKDWFDILYLRFTDDMKSWQTETVRVYQPKGQHRYAGEGGMGFTNGKMMQLANGDLLSPMNGVLKGDVSGRAWIVKSTDQGRTWKYYATIDYSPKDPNPELPGQYTGTWEPSIALLPNGQMLAMLRKQEAHWPGEYKPMYVCWSKDLGKTWTKPVPTKPHLMTISPTLQVLDNGVVACEYGRPGFHVAFSLDNGRTWQDRISFSDLPEPVITGQFDMIKVGPNKLVAVGSDAGGTKVWPITVERVKVLPARVALQGRVLNQQGNPIGGAKVERSPNRYTADSWLESTELDPWKAGPMTIGSPKLGYRSIRKQNGYPTVQTDGQGHFLFESLKLGEYVLTVEAKGYAPQHRHIKVEPEGKPQEFRLKVGRKIYNRVVDDTGEPVSGACVVLNRWHVHSDRDGYFHWSVEAPVPDEVEMRVYKRYHPYKKFNGAVPFPPSSLIPLSQIEKEPSVLKKNP